MTVLDGRAVRERCHLAPIALSDRKEGIVEVFVNRESVLKEPFADLKNFRRAVELQIFCQAQIDRKVHFTADNVVIVTLKESR